MKDHYSFMHGEPLQCENILSGCDFHLSSWVTLVKHKRYFCEFREVMQVVEDKYLDLPKEHKYINSKALKDLYHKKIHTFEGYLFNSVSAGLTFPF